VIPASRWPLGGTHLAVDRAAVRGVLDAPAITPAPGAPPWLLGACNRHGRALAVVDPLALAGRSAASASPRHVIVVDTPRGAVGLCADGPPEAVRLPEPTGPARGSCVMDTGDGTCLLDLAALPAVAEAELRVHGNEA
jgi:hypothetical protein